MHTLLVVATRPPEWTAEQFVAWWRGPHADIARTLPGLIQYRHGAVEDSFDDRSAGWDAYAVLGFATREALDGALVSPEWAAAVEHTGDMRGRRLAWISEEVDLLHALA